MVSKIADEAAAGCTSRTSSATASAPTSSPATGSLAPNTPPPAPRPTLMEIYQGAPSDRRCYRRRRPAPERIRRADTRHSAPAPARGAAAAVRRRGRRSRNRSILGRGGTPAGLSGRPAAGIGIRRCRHAADTEIAGGVSPALPSPACLTAASSIEEGEIVIVDGDRGRFICPRMPPTLARYQTPTRLSRRFFIDSAHLPARTASDDRLVAVIADTPTLRAGEDAIDAGADGLWVPRDNDYPRAGAIFPNIGGAGGRVEDAPHDCRGKTRLSGCPDGAAGARRLCARGGVRVLAPDPGRHLAAGRAFRAFREIEERPGGTGRAVRERPLRGWSGHGGRFAAARKRRRVFWGVGSGDARGRPYGASATAGRVRPSRRKAPHAASCRKTVGRLRWRRH